MGRLTPLVMLLLLASSLPARAAISCKAISVTAMTFASYDVYAPSPNDVSGTISYSCPPPITPSVTIDAGLNSGGSFSPRYMINAAGTEKLAYNVYVDAARTQVWASTPVGVTAANATSVPIYGRCFAGQDVSVGTYTDTLTVTFNF